MAITDLQLSIAAKRAISTLGKMVTPLREFASDFSPAESQKGAVVKVSVFGGDAASAYDAVNNNYATNDGTIDGIDVNLTSHYKYTFKTTDKALSQVDIPFMQTAGDQIARKLGRAACLDVMGKINSTNVSKSAVFTLANAGTKSAIANLYALADSNGLDPYNSVVVVTPQIFAAVLSQLEYNVYGGTEAFRNGYIPGLFGFKSFIASNALTTTASEKLNGAIVGADSIALAARYITPFPGTYEAIAKETDKETGLTIGFREFGKKDDGSIVIAGEMLFGSALAQAGQIVRLVSE